MNENILIIDDEPDVLELLDEALSLEGFQTRTASSGMEGMKIFKSHPFDLVITDIRMPQMDGMEVLKQIKQLDESVEVIMLTGFATLENAIMALRDEGAFDYLTKPLEDIDRLLIPVTQALERRRLRIENKNLIKKLGTANAGLTREIEERKRTEKALQKSEERFKNLFQYAPDAYYLNDLNGIFIDGNKAAEELSGYRKEELIGKNFLDSGLLSQEQLPKAIELLKKNMAGQRTGPDEFILKGKDGGKRTVEIRTLPMKIINKPVVLAIARDITDRKRLEAQLLDSHKMKAIAALAGGIAHQFNNALSSITGHTGLLEMYYPEDKNIMEYTAAMKESAHRMALLTRQLLAYARGGRYNPQSICLSDFVRSTIALIRHTLAPSVHLETNLPQDTHNVVMDRTQMQTVISAIVANSNEAMEGPGRIRVSVRNIAFDQQFMKDHPDLTPGPYACLSVEDDGKGMDKETQNRIFEPFFTTHFVGRGLGMASAYGIIKGHGGWVSVDSEVGKGTVVNVYLPAAAAKEKVTQSKR